ncbi:hypothetical protein [Catenuloplanes indicus]|uniref:Uncharacterized protein n=1 Tax=Catenuloplanes indicus TaxID=137267 RepID=A0AAE3W7D0_9ACTN|nr:hypothetical protein [Catenuloplanes indicus]MDQ0370986.1 hypothetical protein [Catenuloplanes indicus]
MEEIPVDRYGLIEAGENEGFFIRVQSDEESTGGYHVVLVDNLANPSAGGDYWAADLDDVAKLFRLSEWRIAWFPVRGEPDR